MKKIAEYPGCLIAMNNWNTIEVIAAPTAVRDAMDGTSLDDNCCDLPALEVGAYLATIEVWFSQGYSEGFKDDRESEVELRISDCHSHLKPQFKSTED